MIIYFFKKLYDASLQCEFIRTLLGNLYKLCPYFFHPFDTYISSKNWFVSYTVLVYIEGISTGRDFIRKWEQQGSLSFTMVQRYLRVTISYCWSLLAGGCQESNDSSTPSILHFHLLDTLPRNTIKRRGFGSISIQMVTWISYHQEQLIKIYYYVMMALVFEIIYIFMRAKSPIMFELM